MGLVFWPIARFRKNLTNAPDLRSPMDESAIPQNNSDLAAEKGPGCDLRNRFALSSVYDIPAYRRAEWTRVLTQNWQFSMVYQVQSGMPYTISVFGDTANSGTVLGENPIQRGSPFLARERTRRRSGSTQGHSSRRQRIPLEMWGGTRCTDRRCRRWTSRWCAQCESRRN
jgi:hypothetical protein